MQNIEYNTSNEYNIQNGNNVHNTRIQEKESTALPSACGIHLEQRNSQDQHTCHACEYVHLGGDAYWPTYQEYQCRMNVAGDMSCCRQCLWVACAAWPWS